MIMQELKFHTLTDRWRVYEGTSLICPIHCGETVLIQIGNAYLPSSIELDTEWYVRFGDSKYWLHRKTIYKVLLLS